MTEVTQEHTMHIPVDISETSGNGEVWGDWGEGLVDGKNILWLGVERVVINILVVDTILFTTSDTDFLLFMLEIAISLRSFRELTISSHCFIGAARLRYSAVVLMFQSTSSSLKSIMWLENRGSPCSLKYFSSASIRPSNHGRSFLAQWSVCKITGIP